MAKAKTKTQIIAGMAQAAGIQKKQAKAALEALVAMAYKGAKDGFTIPGLGKLVIVRRKARKGRNPATGRPIKIPAKRVLKFRIAKPAKDAIVPSKKK
jgi:DNA-binding protein HU-beta